MDKAPDAASIAQLLGADVQVVTPCLSGGNNRVFRVETAQASYLAKQYFHSTADTRNRLENEWRFLSYAASSDVPHVPRPIEKDDAANLAIYSFLDGARPTAITAAMVAQVGAWVAALNRSKHMPLAQQLPDASEACFSAGAHLALLRQRMAVLDAATQHAGEDFREVLACMQALLVQHGDALVLGYGALGLAPEDDLPRAAQCLSPSDFGFHNSLILPGGQVQLLDFEYAGWDDPAKMLCDFFLHPGMAVDVRWLSDFWAGAQKADSDPAATLARAQLLYPLLGLRWCCIILNVFVPAWAARRQFAHAGWNAARAQAEQLAKARVMLDKIASNPFRTAR